MSDTGRKNVTDQVSQKLTPDSQKSYADKASESASGVADKVAGSVQPGDTKSTTQKLSDATRSGADDAQGQGKTLYEQASEVATNAMNTASKMASDAAEAISGSTKK